MKNLRKDKRITFSETRTKVCLLLSFVMPILVLLAIAYYFNIYPFSSDCIATDSLQQTYLPVISELRRKILNRESLFYSWNVGGGSNFWAWICAYAASPFTLIYFLFPADKIAQATQVIFALKAATASLFLFILFWKKENVVSPVSVALSTAYGLSAYVLTYSQEPWILDTVILLPLLILTLHYLVIGKHKWSLSLVSALVGITCCRSGVYMLLFVIIMFPLLYIEARHDGFKLRKLSDIIKDFFIYLCIGIGLSAIVWYPSLQALWKTVPGNEVVKASKELKVELKAWDFLERAALAPSLVFPGDAEQLPSIYCGIFPVILMLLYAGSRKIRFSEKFYTFCTLAFFYITMCLRLLQFVVHGLHFPITGLYPQAILISFLIMYMAGRTLSRGTWFEDRKQLWVSAALIITFMVLRAALSTSYSYASYTVYMAIGMLIIYYFSTIQIHDGPAKEKTMWMSILAAVMILEAGLSFYYPIKQKYFRKTYQRSISRDSENSFSIDPVGFTDTKKMVYALDNSILYDKPDEETGALLAEKKSVSPAGTRFKVDDPEWNNYGLIYGVPSMNSESYLTPMRFAEVLRNLGINRSADKKSIISADGTTISDTFFQMMDVKTKRFSLEEIDEITSVHTNGFFVSTENVFEDLFVSESPFDAQNKLAYQLASVKPLTELKMEVEETENIAFEDDGYYRAEKTGQRLEITLTSEEFLTDPNIPIYLYCTSEQKSNIEVYLLDIDGIRHPLDSSDYSSGSILKLDTENMRDRRLQIRITIANPDKARFKIFTVIEDREKMKWFKTTTKDGAWNISEFREGYASGTINAPYSGHVVWSIPADSGWSATIDGKKTETFAAYKSFLGIHVPAGEHEITIKYTPDGFVLGAFASGAAVFMLMGLTIGYFLPKKDKKQKETKPEEKETES